MSDDYTVSVVVPTVGDGPVSEAVRAVGRQSDPPAEVVVVDDGDGLSAETVEGFHDDLPESVSLTVVRTDEPSGSSGARNLGADVATERVVLFVDDDTVLGEEYVERLREVYERYDSEDLAGVGGIDASDAPPRGAVTRLYHRLFYLGSEGFRINEAGMSPVTCERTDLHRVDWLVGNNMSFKRAVLAAHPLPQWHEGREPLDDVALGWSLERDGYHCLLDPSLPLTHGHEGGGSQATALRREGRNRVRLFRLYGRSRYRPLFLWAMLGGTLGLYLGELPVALRDPVEWARRGTSFAAGVVAGLRSDDGGAERP